MSNGLYEWFSCVLDGQTRVKISSVVKNKSMTLTLSLTPEIELYLKQRAEQKGISIEAYTLELLTEHIFKKQKQASIVNLLESWLDEDDEQEQKQTGEFLIRALDEDRLSKRKLFPPEMKGVSW
jgi:hypothetical protein